MLLSFPADSVAVVVAVTEGSNIDPFLPSAVNVDVVDFFEEALDSGGEVVREVPPAPPPPDTFHALPAAGVLHPPPLAVVELALSGADLSRNFGVATLLIALRWFWKDWFVGVGCGVGGGGGRFKND